MSLNCLSETVAEMCTGVTREGSSLSGLMSRAWVSSLLQEL